jgi:hypothetical protein
MYPSGREIYSCKKGRFDSRYSKMIAMIKEMAVMGRVYESIIYRDLKAFENMLTLINFTVKQISTLSLTQIAFKE